MFHVPLMILLGPREPRCVDAYMDIVVRDFENWQPGTPGLQVKKLDLCEEHGTTTIRQETVRHWPTLASWIADNPARQKVAAMRGQAAIRILLDAWYPYVREDSVSWLQRSNGYSSCKYPHKAATCTIARAHRG